MFYHEEEAGDCLGLTRRIWGQKISSHLQKVLYNFYLGINFNLLKNANNRISVIKPEIHINIFELRISKEFFKRKMYFLVEKHHLMKKYFRVEKGFIAWKLDCLPKKILAQGLVTSRFESETTQKIKFHTLSICKIIFLYLLSKC